MPEIKVTEFADILKVPIERLLDQLKEAGIEVSSSDDTISEDAKLELLTHLRKSHGRKDPGAASPGKITLNRKSQSEIRLASGKGQARTVSVEVRSKRTYIKRNILEEQAREQQEVLDQELRLKEEAQAELERAAKAQVEQEEKQKEDEKQRKEAEAKEREKEAKLQEEKVNQRKAAQEGARREAEEKRRIAEEEAKEKAGQRRLEKERQRRQRGGGVNDLASPDRTLHVAEGASARRRKRRPRRRTAHVSVDAQHGFERPTEPVVREVEVPETIAVSEIAQRMAVKANDVIKVLMEMGMMVTINKVIDQDTAVLVVEEMGHTAKPLKDEGIEAQLLESHDKGTDEADFETRAPVVTVMGHVDHGKTSLLDCIRRTQVAANEAGGITQHIGAYSVKTERGPITFLDTPGHAAFTAMRARGAQVTDVVVLVVAADDGVMPQTIEAIQHAKAAEVPLVVAVNKVDLESADLDRVRNELSQHEVIPEEWGGENLFVNVSAKSGEGVDKLLEAILLQAEVLDLKATSKGPAAGVVLESSLERGRGAVATVLVSKGSLQLGDILLAGQEYGRIRAMIDEGGGTIEKAGPSRPVAVLGLSGLPAAGDEILVVTDERKAREVAEFRHVKERDIKLARQLSASPEDVFSQMEGELAKSLPIVIKADVHGSSEALKDALVNLSTEEVGVVAVVSGVGGITESDIQLAAASNAVVIGFNVRADGAARKAIKETGVDVRYYSIVYEAIDDVKGAVNGLLAPEIREEILGLAEVRDVFRSPNLGKVAGCMVMDGFVKRSSPIRVLRDNVVIYEGELESLRRFKDDVTDVRAGTECGIGVKNYNDVKVGDQIECYERKEIAKTI